VKIRSVTFNNRKQCFTVRAGAVDYQFPYAALERGPARRRRVVRAFVDPELGSEAFTFETDDGTVDAVHLDNVLLLNHDPRAEFEATLYRLTLAAEEALAESGMSKRSVARRLGASMSQLARLLDATVHAKSIGQMMALLRILGREVEIVVRRLDPARTA
jgi:predicted XRE-type DNA-binding protein